MEIKWKTLFVIIVSILFGFTLAFWVDIPNKITFDFTDNVKEVMEEFDSIIDRQMDYSEQECPIRLRECERLFEYFKCSEVSLNSSQP